MQTKANDKITKKNDSVFKVLYGLLEEFNKVCVKIIEKYIL